MWKGETMLQEIKFYGIAHYNNTTLTISQKDDEAPITNNEFRSILRQIYYKKEEKNVKTLISPHIGLTNGYWELCGFRNLTHINISDNKLVTFLIPNQVVHLNVARNPRLKLVIEVQGLFEGNKRKFKYDPDFIFNMNDFSETKYYTSELDEAEKHALENDLDPFKIEYIDVTGCDSRCFVSLLPWKDDTFSWLNRKSFDFFKKTFPNLFDKGKIEEDIGLAGIFRPFIISKKPRLTS